VLRLGLLGARSAARGLIGRKAVGMPQPVFMPQAVLMPQPVFMPQAVFYDVRMIFR
jgi:hypothetical protein